MAYDTSIADWAREALAPLGHVSVRRMFGGAGLYLDGTIFASLDGDDLWFKSDAEADPDWDRIAPERFTVTARSGRLMTINYRRAPADAYDDPEAIRRYAVLARAAGLRKG